MLRKYSVFLPNVGSCSDRYCSAYGPAFTTRRLFERVASIDRLTGVDLVATKDLRREIDTVKQCLQDTGLKLVSIVPDHFTESRWRQGSFSSTDPTIRQQAVTETRRAMDLAAELNCDLVTVWPGQDGYDYQFQADYLSEREAFVEGIRSACRHRPDIRVSLEYKIKEPRTHSYLSTVGTAILTANEVAEPNCGVVLDFGHALMGYENPAESVALLKRYGDRLMHIHINDNYASWDDDMIVGTVHTLGYLEFFYWLRRTGYDGWITIDQFPYREDGQQAVAESAHWMDALASLAGSIDPEEVAAVLARKDAAASKLMRRLLFGARPFAATAEHRGRRQPVDAA